MAKKILVVDDSKTARMIVIKCFKIAGFNEFEFIEAENGREALKALKTNEINLIATDFNMPVMDGGVLLKWIKGSPHLKDTPVVMITSAGNPAREAEFISIGALAVISKPVSPAAISAKLSSLLEE